MSWQGNTIFRTDWLELFPGQLAPWVARGHTRLQQCAVYKKHGPRGNESGTIGLEMIPPPNSHVCFESSRGGRANLKAQPLIYIKSTEVVDPGIRKKKTKKKKKRNARAVGRRGLHRKNAACAGRLAASSCSLSRIRAFLRLVSLFASPLVSAGKRQLQLVGWNRPFEYDLKQRLCQRRQTAIESTCLPVRRSHTDYGRSLGLLTAKQHG